MILLLAKPKDEKSFLFNTKYNSTEIDINSDMDIQTFKDDCKYTNDKYLTIRGYL